MYIRFVIIRAAMVPTLMEVLDMSEDDAKQWFNDKSSMDFSIAQLVQDTN